VHRNDWEAKGVASKSSRSRRLERARAERRMARLAAQQQRRRRVQAAIGGTLALILIALGTTWLLGGFEDSSEPVTLPICTWTPRTEAVEGMEVTGLPPTNPPTSGARDLTIITDLGEIRGLVELSGAICAGASVGFLSALDFYNGTQCTQLDTTQAVLRCGGDKSPSYQFYPDFLPIMPIGTPSPTPSVDPSVSPSPSEAPLTYYAKGSIVLSNIDVNAVGSQLMFVYGDGSTLPPDYVKIGTVTSGMELIEQIAAGGAVDSAGASAAVGKPVKNLIFLSVTLTVPESPTPSATAAATPTPAASATT
jgi:peptidyl-prolyl cis-trans isomerase B (cyclophilin B)